MSAPKQLHDLQRSLYEKAFAQAKAIAENGSHHILGYSEKYLASLPKSINMSSEVECIKDMHQHTFALYGDFHTLKQSQRGLLRVLKSYRDRYPTRTITLALEMFKHRDQELVDSYMEGQLTEEELLEQIHYHKDWSFPWKNYRMLLDYAREQQIKVIGINTENAGRDPLTKRDQFAANLLLAEAKRDPKQLVLCMIGEYHLANGHLPAFLSEAAALNDVNPRIFRIFTNVDEYYFKAIQENKARATEYLYLRENDYCILNSPPWMKWQSYVIWEEMRGIEDWVYEEDDDMSWYTEDSFDVDSQTLELSLHLIQFLKLPIKKSQLSHINVRVEPDQSEFDGLRRQHQLSRWEMDVAAERLILDAHHYMPEGHTILIGEISLNNIAHCCGQYLRDVMLEKRQPDDTDDEQFAFRVLSYAAGAVASRILNPRRKTYDLWTYRRFLMQNRKRRLVGHAQMKREAAKSILDFHKWLIKARSSKADKKIPKIPKNLVAKDRFSYYEFSKALGHLLGNTFYQKIVSNKLPAESLAVVFRPPSSAKSYLQMLIKLYEESSSST